MRRWLPILLLGALGGACADGVPPVLEAVTRLPDTHDPVGPYRVDAISYDERSLDQVQLLYCVRPTEFDDQNICRTDLDDAYQLVVMENLGSGLFSGEIPGQWFGHTVEYYLLAIDSSDNQTAVPDGAPRQDIFVFAIMEIEED